jgi:hypothetical protein
MPVVNRRHAQQGAGHDGHEPAFAASDGPQPPHQSVRDSLLLVMIAVADTHHLSAVAPEAMSGAGDRADGDADADMGV